MSIEVISIGSSSSGNSYIIKAGSTRILLDVGLTAKKIVGALGDFDIDPGDVDAVLLTHEHVDHVKSVRAIGRKCSNALFVTSRGTAERTENFKYIPEERRRIIRSGDSVEFRNGEDEVVVRSFSLSHDAAEPVGFTVEHYGAKDHCKLGVVTDTGIVTDEIYDAIRDADMLVFEANHDEDLLIFGEYPYHLKVRIKGDHGHLSNKYAGEVLSRLIEERRQKSEATQTEPLGIMLAHLSFHNNAPFYARSTIEGLFTEKGYVRDTDYTLTIAPKDDICILSTE
ncbi:MAG: MBL fold metallo-hydrolase [Mogibacterium sp.]|nr:MBL fold metallo-hydrolase [Mogibacterium sp.]